MFKTNYVEQEQFIKELTNRNHIMDFIFHLVNICNKKYSSYYVYDHAEKKIYISADLLIFKMATYLNEEEREKFFKDVKPNGLSTCNFTNDIVLNFIKSANKYLVFKMGIKPFYLNEEKEIFYVNKFTEFILGEENRKYFGIEKYNFQIKRLNLTKLGYDYLIKYVDFEKLKELEKDIKY